jgi:hypothetical protein
MPDKVEPTPDELTAEQLEEVAGGITEITDGTSNTLMARKAGGTQQDYAAAGETSFAGALVVDPTNPN